jgi:hypothetical protein
MLETIDKHNVMDRTNAKQPVLLLDGHHSRFELPFLHYIHDDNHPWTVCLGVPYGTHIWQVADSPEMNGSFKIALYKAKREYLQCKSNDNQKFVPTDVIPLVNIAWEKSFARHEYVRRAIIKRGWGPLNFVLLDHPKLRPMVPTENETASQTTNENKSRQSNTETSTSTTVVDSQATLTDDGVAAANKNIMLEVNMSGKVCTAYMDCLMDETARRQGSTRRKEERNKLRLEQGANFDKLAGITKVTSGQLAMNDVFCITRQVGEIVYDKKQEELMKKNEVRQRQQLQKEKESKIFRVAYRKYVKNERLLTVDIRSLLKRVKQPDDSPIKSKMVDLQAQWHRRKFRFDDFLLTSEPTPSTTNNDNVPGIFVQEQVENNSYTQTPGVIGSLHQNSATHENPEISIDENVTIPI